MRAPPEFREELHPEEIVRRPQRHSSLATMALVVFALVAAMLLRAVARWDADAPAAAAPPGALQRGEATIAHAPGADDRSAVLQSSAR